MVACNGAIYKLRHAGIIENAGPGGSTVAGNRATVDRKIAQRTVVNDPDKIPGEDRIEQRQGRAIAITNAAIAAAGDGQSRDHAGNAASDVKYVAAVIATHHQHFGSRPGDGEVFGKDQLAVGKRDCTHHVAGKNDRIPCAGKTNSLTEAICADIAVILDGECGRQGVESGHEQDAQT